MDILRRWHAGGWREFKIYTQVEADDLGLKYVHWRDAEAGDWALSDDGYVGECLKVLGPYCEPKSPNRKTREKVFSFARMWVTTVAKLLYEERRATRSYSTMSTRGWAEIEARSARGRRFVQAYIMNFLSGAAIDWAKIGTVYRPDYAHNDPARRAKWLMQQEAFKKMANKALMEVFRDKNITEGDVIDMYKEAYDMAKTKGNDRGMRETADRFRDLLDMLPDLRVKALNPYDDDDIEDAEYADDDPSALLETARKSLPGRKPQVPSPPPS